MKTKLLIATTFSLAFFFLSNTNTQAQNNDSGFIYGKITTKDGESFTGQIRWGKEEAYWTDMFNASKSENEFVKMLSQEDKQKLMESKHGGKSGATIYRWNEEGNTFHIKSKGGTWNYSYSGSFKHRFTCQFGNIKTLTPKADKDVELEFRNGEKMIVGGSGYNDIGTKIKMLDQEIGELELSWSNVRMVEFMNTPNLKSRMGKPIYGTVETRNGNYTGLIQWDHDERISNDRLDGDYEDGTMKIEFGNIKSIERRGNGCDVELKSSRKFFLDGSNDVNRGNRGIIVTSAEFGRVDIEWEDFFKVTFSEVNNKDLQSFNSFASIKKISGTVTTADGKSYSGTFVYDLDEAYGFEVLEGEDNDIEYIIPFALIKNIMPKNDEYAAIELKSGRKMILGKGQDVCRKNEGIIMFDKGPDNPIYISWAEIKEIKIN